MTIPTHHHTTVEEAVECALRNMEMMRNHSEVLKACAIDECIECVKAELASVKGITP